ncbi:RHS repeat-associated core domain-containing protein [Prevotella sp.]
MAYNRFWYYSPELGRYISQDSIGLASGSYCYVQNPLIGGIFGD